MTNLVDPENYPDALSWLEAEMVAADAKKGLSRPTAQQPVSISQAQLSIIMQLDHARRAQHLSMGQLAQKVGMQQSNLSRVWSRKANPSLVTVLKIAEALGVTIVISGGHLIQ